LDEVSQQFLHTVLEKSRHRNVQAYACAALADQTDESVRMARRFKGQPEMAKEYEPFMGKEAIDKLVKADTDKLTKEAERLYERIIKDYSDVSDHQGGKLGKLAERRIDALRNPVLVGKPAPEIDGEDVDGKKFKLSDYRGKVVLLDFWGNW
jgi:hypothetical protein